MAELNQITYIGHATLLLEIDGVRLLTDPLLRDRVFHLHRRSISVRDSLYQNIDAVLISHLHLDHFDIPSLRLIGRETHLIAPSGAANLLHKRGFGNIKEMRPGDITKVGALTIMATHAEHDGRYPLFGPSVDCLGFLIRGSQHVYFPGDTDLFPGMADLASDLDVALLPVWGWGPNLGSGHMNPHRAAEALTLLHPRIAIPIHWGTFYPRWLGWFRAQLMVEPPQIFLQDAATLLPNVDIYISSPQADRSPYPCAYRKARL
jgi:L-ascorbate metabolism protein UlaG (beta-lactamase superfamily)